VGIITDRDLVRRGLAQDLAATAGVEKVMTSPVVTIDADADLHAAFTLFRAPAVLRLAVVDGDEFVGMITVDDLLVDLAVDPSDLARPIAAEVFIPAGWADLSQPSTESNAPTTVTDETGYLDSSDPVRLYVSDDLIRIGADATLHQIAQRLAAEGVGALVVVDGDHVLGVISERDVVRAVAAAKDLNSTTAADIDARHVVTCTPDTTVHAAAALMMEHYVRHLLVEDRNGPIGMVSARDLLGAYA
jgi:CBS domain-containing protein